MQTIMYMTDKQQQIFREKNGKDLIGKVSDAPQEGYLDGDGNRQGKKDITPWYVDLETVAGSTIPPDVESYDNNQFRDTSTINFDPNLFSGIDGLANILNGKKGMVSFETTLVGVKEKPKPEDSLIGTYKVVPLKTFTWGFNFKFKNDGIAGFTGDDYESSDNERVFSA